MAPPRLCPDQSGGGDGGGDGGGGGSDRIDDNERVGLVIIRVKAEFTCDNNVRKIPLHQPMTAPSVRGISQRQKMILITLTT